MTTPKTVSEVLNAAAGALKPFAEASEHLHPSHPDGGLTLDGIEAGQWRAAHRAYHEILAALKASERAS